MFKKILVSVFVALSSQLATAQEEPVQRIIFSTEDIEMYQALDNTRGHQVCFVEFYVRGDKVLAVNGPDLREDGRLPSELDPTDLLMSLAFPLVPQGQTRINDQTVSFRAGVFRNHSRSHESFSGLGATLSWEDKIKVNPRLTAVEWATGKYTVRTMLVLSKTEHYKCKKFSLVEN